MRMLGLQETKPERSACQGRDDSPNSVIFTQESNLSLVSSASGSVDRCSFASDVHDHESFVSELSKHLAGSDLHDSSSGPDLNPKRPLTVQKNSHPVRKGESAKDREEEEIETDDDNQILDRGKDFDSFSTALIECQIRRLQSDPLTTAKKQGRQRPASLDLNSRGSDATGSSPGLVGMKKSSGSSRRSGTFPSPGTPNYRHGSVGVQKGWSSERVPLPVNGSRRYASAALLPLSNGRTLPSKWEDAEKWIFSPVSGDGASRSSMPHPQRRPKSKSGPLGTPGMAFYSAYSPAMPMYDGGNFGSFMAGSPFSTGVLIADCPSGRSGGGGRRDGASGRGSLHAQTEPCIARSASVHGWSDVLAQSSTTGLQDEKLDGTKDAATMISRSVSRRDVATQMSPESSTQSSPNGRPSFSPSPPPLLPIVELQGRHSFKSEIRDVQVDERVTVTRWSKKHGARVPEKGSANVEDWNKKATETQPSAWEVAETAKCLSKCRREEAKITAWENLQKAKAEAAIRKLEMKLEKKRSSSMDKIMSKLRLAQKKAHEMRSSVAANQAHQVARTSSKVVSFRKAGQIGSLSGCFTCHAF
ncbi:PREDICTED: uncharacterized protein LOC104601770 isoform X2 [Nelumbo nucifera]|uniref:Uncharacterized protein LOC104601770 isoform X2 n=1 Tax=Nelumbo nucifera TaxID=4432 RepID=A0A1U8A869_NELNU|nr:PREDICTED: uncharacterized protein LOC104601770 isoform X2 [Nelumbo nucifera]